MANIKCEPWQFQKICDNVLRAYYENVDGNCAEIINKVADATVEELKKTSPRRDGGGQYAESWEKRKAVKDKANSIVSATVYSQAPHYRLTHLLEYGHLIVHGKGQGKRRKPTGTETKRPHIKKAEEKAIIMLQKEIEKGIAK